MNTLQDIYNLITEILQGRSMDINVFYALANLSKMEWETTAQWRKLLVKDTTNSQATSDTYLTAKTLPARFLSMPSNGKGLKLISSSSGRFDMVECDITAQHENKDDPSRFYIDHGNMLYYVCGTWSLSYTHNLFYYQKTAAWTSLGDTWVFPEEFWSFIAFDTAARFQLGLDYDDINKASGNANYVTAKTILKGAIRWNDKLVRSALNV